MNQPSAAKSFPAKTHVVIVGAGPFGLELAVALKRKGIPFEIFDAGAIGQTISWWAPGTRWFSSNERIAIAGVPLLTPNQTKATREEYLTYLCGVAKQFDISVHNYEPVVDIRPSQSGFTVTTKPQWGSREVDSKAVVFAVGGLDRPRRLGIEGEGLPHVDSYLRELHRYYGRKVLIVGGRNSAVEAALRLYHAGAEVILSYRGEKLPQDHIKYWLLPEMEGLIRSNQITAHFNTRPLRITPSHVVLQAIGAAGTASPIEVRAEEVLTLIGYEQDKTLFQEAGIELVGEAQRPQFAPQTLETNIAGLYVGGTAVAGTQSSSYKLFLENCHQHVDQIIAHLTGEKPSSTDADFQRQIEAAPES